MKRSLTKDFIQKLGYLASVAVATVQLHCGDLFSAADSAAANTKGKIDSLLSSVFPLAIGIAILGLLFVRDTKKVHTILIILVCVIFGYVGWKWAYNGTIVNTIQAIFGV